MIVLNVGSVYPTRQRNIRDDISLQLHLSENLKCRLSVGVVFTNSNAWPCGPILITLCMAELEKMLSTHIDSRCLWLILNSTLLTHTIHFGLSSCCIKWHILINSGCAVSRFISAQYVLADMHVYFVLYFIIFSYHKFNSGPGSSVGIATELRAGRSGDRIPVGARFSAPVQTGPEAHPASCKMGTGSFWGVRCCRGVMLTPHPLLVQRSKIE